MHLYGKNESQVAAIANTLISEVKRLEDKYTRFNPDSYLMRLTKEARHPEGAAVDHETARLLDYANTCYEQSGGLFDITSGILNKAWNYHQKEKYALPDQSYIDDLLACTGWSKVSWIGQILQLQDGFEIDLGGIVKEYAVDRLVSLARDKNIQHGLVDLGGDVAVIGRHPDDSPWQVAVRKPGRPESALATTDLYHGGLATSGDYERFIMIDKERYSHILNPLTGWPVKGLSSVSVIADQCIVAGTAATIAILKQDQGEQWLDALGLPNLRIDQAGNASGSLSLQDYPV